MSAALPYRRLTPLVPFDPAIHTITRVGVSLPIPVFTGPVVFNTSAALDVYPRWIWDPNSYYSDLGVDTRASRRDLMDAYLRGDGSSSVRLTMILKNLLDADIRLIYDSTPAGSIFVDDEVLAASRERKLEEMASQPRPPVEASDVDVDEAQEPSRRPHTDDLEWSWGYFLWGADMDTPRLRHWQACLCRVYAGSVASISVGLSDDRGEPAYVYLYGGYRIAFLVKGVEPTDDLARSLNQALFART